MADEPQQRPQLPALAPVAKPLSLIPVILKEAALDSPTFRASAIHFSEQLDLVEKWLENYVKSATKLSQEVRDLENIVNAYVNSITPPPQVSEAILDHDYTILALKRCAEGAKEFWSFNLRGMRKTESHVLEPIKAFLHGDLRALKEARKTLDQCQKTYDSLVSRYAGQAKTKEPSSLREDAFQLHEARKAYLKASMDFSTMAPQVRTTLDKLLVKVFAEQWREMKNSRELTSGTFARHNPEMERVRGWSREMENGERAFKRELQLARKQVEESAEFAIRPSRELDDYATSTVPYLGSHSTGNLVPPETPGIQKAEKQGWLYQRTVTGKPARTVWVRRWFFVKNGIFGWLIPGPRSGGVEESEKIGVLLCNIRPAVQEERRFCFEVKTKDTTITLQAETQNELMEWISSFDVAKRKALEDPASTDNNGMASVDAAFAISPPIAPEFAAKSSDGHSTHLSDDTSGIERSETLPVLGGEFGGLAARASFDVRRDTKDKDGESSGRDHAARIIQKLDLHRKATATPQLSSNQQPAPGGGIASLISTSLASAGSIMPVGAIGPQTLPAPDGRLAVNNGLPSSTLAPSTLANPPAPTNLSKTAVIVSSERGIGLGRSDGGMPSGILANLWGSANWGYVNRLERGEVKPAHSHHDRSISQPPSPTVAAEIADAALVSPAVIPPLPRESSPSGATHRKTISLGSEKPTRTLPRPPALITTGTDDGFPSSYPLPLRAQDAQFRVLFPNVPHSEKVVLVFRAVWNPTEQQEFPGRTYVTERNVFFYSNHLGLILITGISLSTVEEVTAAPGRDCDFLFLHFKDGARQDGYTRITIKTFLEPLRLLQRRLDYLVRNCNSPAPAPIEEVINTLLRFETDEASISPSAESWEDIDVHTPIDGSNGWGASGGTSGGASGNERDVRTRLRIDGSLQTHSHHLGVPQHKHNATKFKLPSQPVLYTPPGMTDLPVEQEFNISAKALFHVLFGDKSAVFQLLYRDRNATHVTQTPWSAVTDGSVSRTRQFLYEIASGPRAGEKVTESQTIDVLTDHLCYEVSDRKHAPYLPFDSAFVLLSKIVVTHAAKGKCKLSIHTKVEWLPDGTAGVTFPKTAFLKNLLEARALNDLRLAALDLADVAATQAKKLGTASRTRKALQIFGPVGQSAAAVVFEPKELPAVLGDVMRFRVKPATRGELVLEHLTARIVAWGWAVLGTVASGMKAGWDWVAGLVTAHRVLVGLLVVSAVWNGWFVERETWGWWRERRAKGFLKDVVGLGDEVRLVRGVQCLDLEESMLNVTAAPASGMPELWVGNETGSGAHNRCRRTYVELVKEGEEGLEVSVPRQRLEGYRHDLLVALRVVNKVEQELAQAEYERWLWREAGRCREMRRLLMEEDVVEEEDDEVKDWLEGYCGDCEGEAGRVGLVGIGGR